MATEGNGQGSPSRRDFLKAGGIGALTMAVAGCEGLSDEGDDGGSGNQTDDGGAGTNTGTGTGTPGGDGEDSRDDPFVAGLAAVPEAFAQEAEDDLTRATFLDERYTRIEGAIPGFDAPEEVTPVGHAVTYGHGMRLPEGLAGDAEVPDGQPFLNVLSAGFLSLPNPDVEGAPANAYAERSLSELVSADEENLVVAAAGLGPNVEWLNEPVSVEQTEVEVEFVEGTMTVETFVAPVSAEPGPGMPDPDDDGFLGDATAPRPQMMTLHVGRGFVGGTLVIAGMINGWRRPPSMGPPPEDIGEEYAGLQVDIYGNIVQEPLFRRVLGEAEMLLAEARCDPDETGPPPERVDRTVEYDDHYGLRPEARVELGYPDEERSSPDAYDGFIQNRTAPGPFFDCEEYDPEIHDPGEKVHLTIEQQVTAYTIDEDDSVPFGVIASPRAEFDGEERNPLVDGPLTPDSWVFDGVWDLVNEIVPFGWVDWGYSDPTEIESFPQIHIEGRDTEAKGFEGTVRYSPEGDDDIVEASAYLYVARLTTADEVVVACAFSIDTGDGEFFDSQEATSRVFRKAAGDVVRDPAALGEWVDGSVDPNLVQICRDTHLETGSGDVLGQPNPDLVETRNTAAPFDVSTFDGTAHSGKQLEYGVFSLDVLDQSSRLGQTILEDTAVDDLDTDSTDPDVLFDSNRANDSNSDNDLPVFRLQPDYDSLELTFQAPSGYVHDTTTLEEGSDYSTTGLEHLRVGFITVSDPENGANYGDGDGGPNDYDATVEAAFEFLKRTFPGGISAYRHDAAIEGVKNVAGNATHNTTKDYRNARVSLERIAKPGNNNWSYSGTTMAYRTTESDARSAIRSHGFDVWVMITPDGYYDFHNEDVSGLAPGPNRLGVGAAESAWYNRNGRVDAAETVAQEIAHRLGTDQYRNPTSGNNESNPLAQRDDGGTDQGNRDFDHARHLSSDNDGDGGFDRPGLVSRAYSLVDGEFIVPVSTQWSGSGYEVVGAADGTSITASRVGRMESYMSYSDQRVWTDSIVTQDIIDGNLNRDAGNFRTANVFFGGLNEVSAGAAGGDSGDDPTPSVSDLQVAEATVPESDEGRSTESDPVEVALYGPEGTEAARTAVPPQTPVDGDGVDSETLTGDATFALEFPPEAVEMRVVAETGTVSVNPITRALREPYDRLPEQGFAGEPATVRDQVDALLVRVDEAMAEGDFGIARDELQAFAETELAGTVDPEFEPAPNQYGEARLRALFDEMIGRLDGLAGGGPGDDIVVGEAPPWTDWIPEPSELPVFADSRGLWQYDVASILESGGLEEEVQRPDPMANPFLAGAFARLFWQELGTRGIGEEVVGSAVRQEDVDPAEVPAETGVFLGTVQLYLGDFDTGRLDTAVSEGPFTESETAGVYVHTDADFSVAYGGTYVVAAESPDEVATMLATAAGDLNRWYEGNDEVEWLYETGATGDFTVLVHREREPGDHRDERVDFSPFTDANGLAQSTWMDGETFTEARAALVYPSEDAVELAALRETLGVDAVDRSFAQDGRFVQVSATYGE